MTENLKKIQSWSTCFSIQPIRIVTKITYYSLENDWLAKYRNVIVRLNDFLKVEVYIVYYISLREARLHQTLRYTMSRGDREIDLQLQ